MYWEYFHLNRPPFQEQSDSRVFFAEAGRGLVLQSLITDINKQKSLIKLIGGEGSGKTLICKLLSLNLPKKYEPIYIDNPLGSFDDLLRIICRKLGVDSKGINESVDYTVEFSRRLSIIINQNRSILIIIDEADKLFLATLERLIRLLCEVDETGTLQVILSGRPGLEPNLDQLSSYCANVNIKTGYFLEPFNSEETASYLQYCLDCAAVENRKPKKIFTGDAADKIHAIAQGDIRLTNVLAEQSLQNSYSEKSAYVLPEHVFSHGNTGDVPAKISISFPGLLEKNPFFSFFKSLTKIKLFFQSEFFQNNKKLLNIGSGFLIALLFVVVFSVERDNRHIKPPESIIQQQNQPASEKNESVYKQKTKEQQDVVSSTLTVAENSAKKKRIFENKKSIGREPLPKEQKDKTMRNGDAIFKARLRSGSTFLAGAYRGDYTIQLMVLASKLAVENLKKMLVQDDFYAVKDNLFIIRKKSSPPTLFVFYGSFRTLEQAREVRNSLPVFLRKHHPYSLSINDALKKIED